MNRQIKGLGIALMVLFSALFVQLNYLQIFHAKSLNENPANTRAVIDSQVAAYATVGASINGIYNGIYDLTDGHQVKKYGGSPGPFDMLVVTSIPNLLGTPGEPVRPSTFARWHPDGTRIPSEAQDALMTALRQYGRIPEFEPTTASLV